MRGNRWFTALPQDVIVRNGNNGSFTMQCGPQEPSKVSIFYVPSSKKLAGVDGYFCPRTQKRQRSRGLNVPAPRFTLKQKYRYRAGITQRGLLPAFGVSCSLSSATPEPKSPAVLAMDV